MRRRLRFWHGFRVDASGKGQTLYSFGAAGQDGRYPNSNLVVLDGALYGATIYGGNSPGCGQGCGTIFKVDQSGNETVLHNFDAFGSGDGYYPDGGLIAVGHTLYGTTLYGGTAGGYGTVFAVTTRGQEKLLTSFRNGSGAFPYGGR